MVDRGVPRDRNTRLVYSTGREAPGGAEPARTGPATKPRERVRIRLDRRAGGRLATIVTGLVGPKAALVELARSLKTTCGAGGTFKDGVLELQGDHRDAVEAALRARGLSPKRAGG